MTTRLTDVVVPEIFTPYTQRLTQEKSRLIQSGVVVVDPQLSSLLSDDGGSTFNMPSWHDLVNEEENVSNDDPTDLSTPSKTTASPEIAVRLARNNSWSGMDLTAELAGSDPMDSIANRVAYYWTRRSQAAYVATIQGVFADNDQGTPNGQGSQGDLTHDISGVYQPGVTDFSAEAVIDALVTMGDSMDNLRAILMHSIVYSRAQKNNLIDFIPDARGEIMIPTFLGREVIVDDGMPNPAGIGPAQTPAGVFHTWLMTGGTARMGVGTPKEATETDRTPAAGGGGGQETLYNRVTWAFHPNGHAWIGTAASVGGPTNTELAAGATNWQRVYVERKQVNIARLITTEM